MGPLCPECGRVEVACICVGCGLCNVHYIKDCKPWTHSMVYLPRMRDLVQESVTDFAKRHGFDARTVLKAMKGKLVRPQTAQRFADALGVRVDDLRRG